MKIKLALIFAASSIFAGCASSPPSPVAAAGKFNTDTVVKVQTRPDATSTASTLADYKQDIAQRISQVNSIQVYAGKPQALLRSVIVVRYAIDGSGNLLRSEIMRSNRDAETEATALAALRNAAPFPKPAAHLLHHGRVELAESWLFNNDGRFQLRSVALPQMTE